MSIGDPMTATIPPVGASGTGYATLVNAFLTEVKSLLEAQIPMGSILIDALDMQNNEILNVKYLGLYDQLTLPADVGTLQSYSGDLYWVNAAGAVQITQDGALNAAAVGGITGDYGGANPAQWRFDDADQTFYGYDDFAGSKWARVQARDFRITGAYSGAERLIVTWVPGTSYTLTLPQAPPGAGQTGVLEMDENGVISVSQSLTDAIYAPDFKYTDTQILRIPAGMATINASGGPAFTSGAWVAGTSTGQVWYPIPLRTDERILAWTLYANKTSAAGTITATLVYVPGNLSGGSVTVGVAQTNAANNPGLITLTQSGLTEQVSSDRSYYLVVTGGGTTGDSFYNLNVSLDKV